MKIWNTLAGPRIPLVTQINKIGHPKLSILLIMNSGRERIAIKVATLHALVHEVHFVGELMPSVINIRGSIMTTVLTFCFTPNGFASLQCGETRLPLPETVSIQ